jgi:hypothetical protein
LVMFYIFCSCSMCLAWFDHSIFSIQARMQSSSKMTLV